VAWACQNFNEIVSGDAIWKPMYIKRFHFLDPREAVGLRRFKDLFKVRTTASAQSDLNRPCEALVHTPPVASVLRARASHHHMINQRACRGWNASTALQSVPTLTVVVVVWRVKQERLLDPHVGDLVEVAWKGKFRLESLDIYQGLAWWSAIVVDKSDGSR
jgi:hypothetical protein